MSVIENEVWLEAAHENLEQAIAIGNWSLAEDIIADTAEQGFEKEARQMREELRSAPLCNFLPVLSPYPHGNV